jgi:hypothetical protein
MSDAPAIPIRNESGGPHLLAPDAPGLAITQAVDKVLEDLRGDGDRGALQVSFNHLGVTAKVFVRAKNVKTGVYVRRTFHGEVDAAGYVTLTW